ncbi:MAG: class I SAM-dependent methyltransferase [Pseudomonadota bacterium]
MNTPADFDHPQNTRIGGGAVPGTAGYARVVDAFIRATDSVPFEALHAPYLDFLPQASSDVLDIGAGAGRDAAVLADMGHRVVAVEPMPQFLHAARQRYAGSDVFWLEDALPDLHKLDALGSRRYQFVLASAVWHHIDDVQRAVAMARISSLTQPGGVFALSLRNGPAGAGTHVIPTDQEQTIRLAEQCGFALLVVHPDQPSLLPGKADVRWCKLAFKRVV